MSTVFVKDLVERTLVTFLQAWLGGWLALQDQRLEDLFAPETLMVGVVAAVGAILKALAARQVGDPDSASLAAEV